MWADHRAPFLVSQNGRRKTSVRVAARCCPRQHVRRQPVRNSGWRAHRNRKLKDDGLVRMLVLRVHICLDHLQCPITVGMEILWQCQTGNTNCEAGLFYEGNVIDPGEIISSLLRSQPALPRPSRASRLSQFRFRAFLTCDPRHLPCYSHFAHTFRRGRYHLRCQAEKHGYAIPASTLTFCCFQKNAKFV